MRRIGLVAVAAVAIAAAAATVVVVQSIPDINRYRRLRGM